RLRGFAIAILSDLRSVIQVVRIRGREVTEETGDALGHRGKEHRSLCSRCRLWIADAGVLGCGRPHARCPCPPLAERRDTEAGLHTRPDLLERQYDVG